MKQYKVINKLAGLNNVCVIGHVDPDTDALCSMVVLRNFLLKTLQVKNVDLFADYKILPPNYLPIIEGLEFNVGKGPYDAVIMIDCTTIERTGCFRYLLKNSDNTFNIDHHATNEHECKYNIVENISSACELVFTMLKVFKHKFTTEDYGKCYAGILTDTMSFSVGEVSKQTFAVASECRQNCNHSAIYQNFLANDSLKSRQVLAQSIKNIKSFSDGKILISYITKRDQTKLSASSEDYMGIINSLRTIIGSKFVVFIYPKDRQYYVSSRCDDAYDVGSICKKLGGGGHKCAAAFLSNESVDDITEKLVKEFEKQLKKIKESAKGIFE